MGPTAAIEPVLCELVVCLEEERSDIQAEAIQVIQKIGSPAVEKKILRALVAIIKNKETYDLLAMTGSPRDIDFLRFPGKALFAYVITPSAIFCLDKKKRSCGNNLASINQPERSLDKVQKLREKLKISRM